MRAMGLVSGEQATRFGWTPDHTANTCQVLKTRTRTRGERPFFSMKHTIFFFYYHLCTYHLADDVR